MTPPVRTLGAKIMIEKMSAYIDVFTLMEKSDVIYAADAVMSGKITLLNLGSVFTFVIDPIQNGLMDRFNLIKERQDGQILSLACTYEQAKQFVDKERVNQDFFRLSEEFTGRVIVRIPIDQSLTLPFPYNTLDGTTQFLNIAQTHPLRRALIEELTARGCEYLSITSGNVHGAPTVEDLASAKRLAGLVNMKAPFFGMDAMSAVVTDVPGDKAYHNGSYIILSFCNPDAIEVRRLANKSDMYVTKKLLSVLLEGLDLQTPLIYDFD